LNANAADTPENDVLELPSSYTIPEIQQYHLIDPGRVEYNARMGHAYDAINDMRSCIHIYNACSLTKRIDVFGQRAATRAWAILNELRNDIRECATRYRIAFDALRKLGLPETSELQALSDDQLWGKDMTSARKPGDMKRKEPWFWSVGKPRNYTDSQWELECTSLVFLRLS
jgi:hypothetical protein